MQITITIRIRYETFLRPEKGKIVMNKNLEKAPLHFRRRHYQFTSGKISAENTYSVDNFSYIDFLVCDNGPLISVTDCQTFFPEILWARWLILKEGEKEKIFALRWPIIMAIKVLLHARISDMFLLLFNMHVHEGEEKNV